MVEMGGGSGGDGVSVGFDGDGVSVRSGEDG